VSAQGPQTGLDGRVVIVGAGQAGGEAAVRLRQAGFVGAITLIGEEPEPPYQRPPLSKKYLSGEMPLDRVHLKPIEAYEAMKIEVMLGRKAGWIDRANQKLRLDGAQELGYDWLILATGSKARRLPVAGADLPGVFTLRTIADVDAIRPHMTAGARLCVIGAGYIGLEVAAIARAMGVAVTVVEAAARPLARVAGETLAGFFLDEHTRQGVRFLLGAQAAVIKGSGAVRAVGLSDGAEIACDLVIAGIGILPDIGLAETAGLRVEDGIVTDATTRTADPAIFAIGDCARRPIPFYGGRMVRLESVHNALEGAKLAASAITGTVPPALEAPWFWSDQYDLKLQIAGLFAGHDTVILRGDPKDRRFAVFYLKGDQLLAVDAVNSPAEYLGAKLLIQKHARLEPAALSDISTPFKEIVARATTA
jgi:3-phenylpropionate/trans-cinnamate dioxygenase ferredoxin reductase subunit